MKTSNTEKIRDVRDLPVGAKEDGPREPVPGHHKCTTPSSRAWQLVSTCNLTIPSLIVFPLCSGAGNFPVPNSGEANVIERGLHPEAQTAADRYDTAERVQSNSVGSR